MEGEFYNQVGISNPSPPSAQALALPSNPASQENTAYNNNYQKQPVPTGTPTIKAALYPTAGDDKFGQRARSWLYREQYRDYQTRFEPVERQFVDETLSTKLLDERLAQISINSDRAFDVSQKNANIRRESYGVQQDGQQKEVFDRQNEYAKAFSNADAQNNARTYEYDRRMNTIFGGGAPRQALQEV